MGFLDKVRENIQETTALAREGVEKMHTKHELGQAYGELGRKVVELIEAGTLHASELDADVEQIRKLKAELAAEESAADNATS